MEASEGLKSTREYNYLVLASNASTLPDVKGILSLELKQTRSGEIPLNE